MSTLLPGVQIVAAPRFHIDGAWPNRLSLNSGIAIDDNRIYPRADWRSPTPAELEILTKHDNNLSDSIQLFSIPEHLHARWWSLAAESSEGVGLEGAAFKSFAKDVRDYLHFKRMPLSPESMFEVILTAPGRPSVHPNAGGLIAQQTGMVLSGGINLSDEEASVVFLNLRENTDSGSESGRIEGQRRLLEHRDYPLTRMMLRPREGYWLPHRPIIMDRDTRGRAEVDVHLTIKQLP